MEEIKPGIYDMTNADYHSCSGVSRSGLWLYHENPLKYWYKYLSGQYEQEKTTKAFAFGSLCHTVVLEEHLLEDEYIVEPELFKLPKVGLLRDLGREEYERQKAARADAERIKAIQEAKFAKLAEGKKIVDREDYQKAQDIKNTIYNNEEYALLLKDCHIEKSIFWIDQETGVLCKVRPDAYKPGIYALDLKTEESASGKNFKRSANKYGYYLQAGMIWEAMKAIGEPIERFIDLAIEKEKPHCSSAFIMDDEAIQYGLDLFHSILRKFAVSRETNRYDDYGVQILTAPQFEMKELNNE